MKILVLNSGSSSQKSSLYEIGDSVPDDPPPCRWEGKIEWDGEVAEVSVKNAKGTVRKERTKAGSRAEAVEQLLSTLWNGDTRAVSAPSGIDVVGHRVVHGGPHYEDPVPITPEVKAAIAKVSAFAPLHNRAELEGMEIVEQMLDRCHRLRFSIPDSIAKCRWRPQFILAPMSGFRTGFTATDFTASIISTAPAAPRDCWAGN